jgi:hypothetical protein
MVHLWLDFTDENYSALSFKKRVKRTAKYPVRETNRFEAADLVLVCTY